MRGDLEKLAGAVDYILPTWFWEKDEKSQKYVRLLVLIRGEKKNFRINAPLLMLFYPFGDPSKARVTSISATQIDGGGVILDVAYMIKDESLIEKLKETMEKHLKKGCIDDYMIVKSQENIVPNILLRRFMSPSGARMYVQYKAFFQGLFVNTIKEHGKLGEMILEKIGESVAKSYARTLKEKGITSVDKALKTVMITGSSLGLFRLKSFKVFKNPKFLIIQITLEDLFEERIYREEDLNNKSSYELGFIKGIVKYVTGLKEKDFTVTETKTIDYRDNRSVFIIKIPIDKLERSL